MSLLALNVNAETQPLAPLNSLLERRPRWASDPTDIAFVSARWNVVLDDWGVAGDQNHDLALHFL